MKEIDHMQMDRIGAGILQRRKQLGLSQEELAKQLGVTRQAVSKWESGAALPSVDNIVELSRVLSVSVDELLQLEKKSSEPGLSAESVGRLLDEQALRQEKRIRRLTAALIAAAAVLAIGIALTSVLSILHANRMEDNLNQRISDTNTQLHSQISGIQSSIAGTVKQALDEGNTLLADGGCHGENYVHETQSVEMKLFAYPQTLGDQTDAEFYALLSDGSRITVPAERTAGGFEGMISIPAEGGDSISVDVYVSWKENGQTVTEKILSRELWFDQFRLDILDVAMDYNANAVNGQTVLLPHVVIVTGWDFTQTYPAKVLFEIYVGTELWKSVGVPCEWEVGQSYGMVYPDEEIVLDGYVIPEDLSMRVTVTDVQGNEFVETWLYTEE